MDETIESSVNAESENIVGSQTEEIVQPTENVNEEVVTSQQEEKPQQSAEENAIYAKIRREAQEEGKIQTQKAIDAEYSRMYGESHNIHSKADYDNAIKAQQHEADIQNEAQKQGISEELARRLMDLEENNKSVSTEKAEYQRQLSLIKEDSNLKKDEVFSDYYCEHETDIKSVADKFNVDLKTALLLSIGENFKAIKEGATAKAQQDTIKNIIKNGKSSPGSLSQGGDNKVQSVWDMSPEAFKKYKQSKFEE